MEGLEEQDRVYMHLIFLASRTLASSEHIHIIQGKEGSIQATRGKAAKGNALYVGKKHVYHHFFPASWVIDLLNTRKLLQ